MVDRVKRPEDYEGILLVAFVANYGTLTPAWELGGLIALVIALTLLTGTVITVLLSGRAGMFGYQLWFIFTVTSAIVLSSSLRERYTVPFWPEGLVLMLVGSLSVGVSIAMYPRYVAPHIRGTHTTPSRSHDRV